MKHTQLADFGGILAAYRGRGYLIEPSRKVPCTFHAAQFRNGGVLVLARASQGLEHYFGPTAVGSVEGTLKDGRRFQAFGRPRRLEGLLGVSQIIRFQDLSVDHPDSTPRTSVRFGITNFIGYGTDSRRVQVGSVHRHVAVMPFRLREGSVERIVTIVPLADSEAAENRMRRLKTPDVAAEAEFVIGNEEQEEIDQLMTDLCHILSVARGTTVQWIYRVDLDATGREIGRHHFDRVTKAVSVLRTFAPTDVGETKSFVEAAYPLFVRRRERYSLTRGTIAAYLDAKTEHDYLEMRGVKAVVAMEMLKAAYLDGAPDAGFHVEPHLFDGEPLNAVHAAVKQSLKESLPNVNSKTRGGIGGRSKVREMNRRSFGSVLEKFFEEIGFRINETEMNLVVRCRNSLIHRGRFYIETATEENRRECPPKETMYDEYEFIITILDRAFLCLLGFTGSYEDWRGQQRSVIDP